jgi:hypothetical protein
MNISVIHNRNSMLMSIAILSVCIDFLESILNSCQNAFLLPVHVDAPASKLSKWSKSTIHNYRLNIMNHFTDSSHIVLCTKPFDPFSSDINFKPRST